jgi:hypothetical protein
MKTLNYIIILVFVVALLACDKNENEATENPDVETYIALLKSNQYDSLTLPAFTYKDIPELLQYRSENQLITSFPHNPVSSLWESECKLGIYVLWTIESIRAVSINSEYLLMRFPSQNPSLALRNAVGLKLVSDSISHKIAADAYYDWWESNRDKVFDDFKNIDPLENTDYRWN